MSPRESPPAVRIRKSADADLISIVDRRSSDPGHLHGHSFSHDRLVHAFLCRFRSYAVHPAHNMVRAGEKAGMVMVGQLVHGNLKRRSEHAGHVVPHGSHKVVRIPPEICPTLVAVLLHSGQEPGKRFHKCVIVHDTVPLISLEPVDRISIVFRQDQSVGIRALHFFSKTLPEHMIVFIAASQVCCNIQSPSVHIIRWRNPFLSYVHDILLKFR